MAVSPAPTITAAGSVAAASILWRGPLSGASGPCADGRALVRGLIAAGASLAAEPSADASESVVGAAELERLADLASRELPVVDASVQHGIASGFDPYARGRLRVGRSMFETAAPPAEWMARLSQMDQLWVPSAHNRDALVAAGIAPERIVLVPSPLELDRLDPATPAREIPGAHGTVFLAVFEWTRRKGWDVLLDAWSRAFGPDDDVTLIVKTSAGPGRIAPEEIGAQAEAHLRALGRDPEGIADLIVLTEVLPEREMPALLAACDVIVLPTRGEGWGRPVTEAMAMGRPAIATDVGCYDQAHLVREVRAIAGMTPTTLARLLGDTRLPST